MAVALRLPFLRSPPLPDEAGYLMVARQWHLSDNTMYGAFWVDRPPLLLLLFKAGVGEGPLGIRVVGLVMTVALVLAAAAVGRVVAGPRAAWWCSLAAAALTASFALTSQGVDGELLAAPFVLVSCAATLWALAGGQTRSRRLVLGLVAGLTAMAAVFVKQNFVDALVFAAVLLALTAWKPASRRPAVEVAVAGTAGAAAVLVAVLAWAAATGPGVGNLLFGMYGFRFDAAEVIARGDVIRPEERLRTMLAVALVSGLAPVLAVAVGRVVRQRGRVDPLSWAYLAMLAVGVVGVAAGGNYWRHYLIQLVPAAVIGIALLARHRSSQWTRPLVGVVVLSSLVAMVVGVAAREVFDHSQEETLRTARWLQARSAPGDTALVTYGHANVLFDAGLTSPYPYLWTLPMRVRDPHLDLLVATLRGPDAPTWIVEWSPLDSWGLDSKRRVAAIIGRDYHVAAVVAGHNVYRHDGRPPDAATPGG